MGEIQAKSGVQPEDTNLTRNPTIAVPEGALVTDRTQVFKRKRSCFTLFGTPPGRLAPQPDGYGEICPSIVESLAPSGAPLDMHGVTLAPAHSA